MICMNITKNRLTLRVLRGTLPMNCNWQQPVGAYGFRPGKSTTQRIFIDDDANDARRETTGPRRGFGENPFDRPKYRQELDAKPMTSGYV